MNIIITLTIVNEDMFENRQITKHKDYSNFVKKNIVHSNKVSFYKQKYENQEKMSSCGMKMKIVKYRNHKDIDVLFEDGSLVEHVRLASFKNGTLKHPQIRKNKKSIKKLKQTLNNKHSLERINQTNTANNGQLMTIIAYRKADDIDIMFEDKTIVYNKRYRNFLKGEIRNPNVIKIYEETNYRNKKEVAICKEAEIM